MTGDQKKKPTAGFWITVALVAVLVGYPLSFGPACWLASHTRIGREMVAAAYQPLIRWWAYGPKPISRSLEWWMGRTRASEWHWDTGPDGSFLWINVEED